MATPINLADIRDDQKLLRVLRELEQRVTTLQNDRLNTPIVAESVTPTLLAKLTAYAARNVQAGGQYPINLSSLHGVGADPQLAAPVILAGTTTPTTSAATYALNTLGVLPANGSNPDTFWRVVGSSAGGTHSWSQIATSPSNMVTTDTTQSITGAKTFLAPFTFDFTRGMLGSIGTVNELVTLSTVGATTDTALASFLPALSLILTIGIYIDTTITGPTASLNFGDPTTAARFFTGFAPLTAGTASVGLEQWDGSEVTLAGGPTQYANAKGRITAVGGTPTAGKVRLTSTYLRFVPPTS
jgi:hypothetical protein